MEAQCCLFSRGEFFIRESSFNCQDEDSLLCEDKPFISLGNISTGLIEINSQVLGKENFFNPALPKSRTVIDGVDLTVTLTCADDKNLRKAFLGVESEATDGSFVEELCVGEDADLKGMLIPFKNKGVTDLTLYLTAADTEPLEVSASEYFFDSSALNITGSLNSGSYTHIRASYNYDSSGFMTLNSLIGDPKYYELYFKGFNMESGEGVIFDAQLYKVLFNLNNVLDLISKDEFTTFTLTGSVERTTSGWFKISRSK